MTLIAGQQPAAHEVVVIASTAPAPSSGGVAPPVAPPAPVTNLIASAQAAGVALRPMFPDATIHAPSLGAAAGPPPNPELAAIEQEQKRFFVAQAASAAEAQQLSDQLKT